MPDPTPINKHFISLEDAWEEAFSKGPQPKAYDDEHSMKDFSEAASQRMSEHRQNVLGLKIQSPEVGPIEGLLVAEEFEPEARQMKIDFDFRDENRRRRSWVMTHETLLADAKASYLDFKDEIGVAKTRDEYLRTLQYEGVSVVRHLARVAKHYPKRWKKSPNK